MRLSDAGRTLIKGFEGLSLTAYPDPKLPKNPDGSWKPEQLWSIGYGHQLGRGSHWQGQTITRAQADKFFDEDVARFEIGVTLDAPTTTQAQFDALVSLAYNIGLGAFRDSTVRRLHNLGDTAGAADAFRMWKKAGGVDHPGLIARREKERGVYLYGHGGSSAFPAVPEPMTPAAPAPPLAQTPGWPEGAPPLGHAPASGSRFMLAAIVALASYLGWRLMH